MDLTCPAPATATEVAPISLRLFVPDFAMLISVVTLVLCLVLLDGTRQLFRDSDAGWHIRNGEHILATGSLPRTDSWSLTKSGQPWFAWEWGADVLSGAAHRAGGPAFVAGLYGILIALSTWLWFRLQWAIGTQFLLAAAGSFLLLGTGNVHWLARPHVFGWVMLLTSLVLIERGVRSLAAVAAIALVWANVHASFFLFPVVLLIYAGDRLLRSVVWTGFERRPDWRDARWFCAAAAIALLATLANPYGWAVHQHVLEYLRNTELLDRVAEFQSFNFRMSGAWPITTALLISGLGAVLALGQRKLAHFGICALFVVMGLQSARVLPIVALVALPLACGAISCALRDWTGLQPKPRRALDSFLRYGNNLRVLDRRFSGIALAIPMAVAMFAMLSLPSVAARAGFPAETFPVLAADRVAQLPASARILAPDSFGGYLIYRFDGARKVWFDGRSDFYGASFMKQYIDMIDVRPGALDRIAKAGFTHALLPPRYSLVPALERQGWESVYSDTTAVLLQAPSVKD